MNLIKPVCSETKEEPEINNLSMCREAIPLAGRLRPREALPEGM